MSASVHATSSSPESPRSVAALPAGLRWALRLLSAAAVAASLVYLALFARRNAAALPAIAWSGEAVGAAAGAALLYVANLVNAAVVWHLLLRSLGEPSRAAWAVPVYLLSQVGKYLPGNVGHYVG
ncbi:MAG TPA: hypothetical protein VGE98_03265, partial [Thermoanaerobaculia bacterium]